MRNDSSEAFFGFPSPIEKDSGTVYALTYIYSPQNKNVGFWISFNNWSPAGGRRVGPAPLQGEWDRQNRKYE